MKSTFFIAFLFLIFCTEFSSAQINLSGCEILVKKKKVKRAIDCFERKTPEYPNNIKLLCRLTELYYEQKNIEKCKYYARRAVGVDADKAYNPLYYLARKMSFRRDNNLAVYVLDLLGNRISNPQHKQMLGGLKRSYLLQKYELNQSRYNVLLNNLGDSINSTDAEYLPSLSLDGNTMVFTRRINGANEDFFIAQKDSLGDWQGAKNLGYPPNTGFPDGAAKLSADGNYLFFTRCDMRSTNGRERGGCDLVFCYRVGEENGIITWSDPQYFRYTINTVAYEGQPCLSSDNKDLYFVSDREGGYGGKDIYVSHFENNFWTEPINVGAQINTKGNETTPFIHPDNETLYFSSTGHPTMGDADIFMSRKISDTNWKKVVNLGAPINTKDRDGGIVIDARGDVGYLASQRAGSRGKLDIYSFELYNGIKPIPTLCLKGKVRNKKTKELIKGQAINFYHWPNNKLKTENISNKGDASFTEALHIGKQYLLEVLGNGYIPYYKILDLRKDTFPSILYNKIELKEPGIIDSLGSFKLWLGDDDELTEESQLLLDSMYSKNDNWLLDSADVKLKIESYYYYGDNDSDSTSTSEYYNLRLQQINKITEIIKEAGLPQKDIKMKMSPYIWRDEAKRMNYILLSFVEFY